MKGNRVKLSRYAKALAELRDQKKTICEQEKLVSAHVHNEMEALKLDSFVVGNVKVVRYDATDWTIDPIDLYRFGGQRAFECYKVLTSKAREQFGQAFVEAHGVSETITKLKVERI